MENSDKKFSTHHCTCIIKYIFSGVLVLLSCINSSVDSQLMSHQVTDLSAVTICEPQETIPVASHKKLGLSLRYTHSVQASLLYL